MRKFIVLPLLVLLAACTDDGVVRPVGPDGPAFAKLDKCSPWPTCRNDGDGDGDTEGEYTVTDLPMLSDGGGGSAWDINKSGDVVGVTNLASGLVATLWRFGNEGYAAELVGGLEKCAAELDMCTSTHAYAINDDADVIVGAGAPDGWTSMPVRWTPSAGGDGWDIHSLPTTETLPEGAAQGVASDGVIAGDIFFITPDVKKRSAVVWSPNADAPTLLPELSGFTYSNASGINNAGYVVGSIRNEQFERHAVLWVPTGSGYTACSLHPPLALFSSVSAVSEPVSGGGDVKVLGLTRFPDGPSTVTVWTLTPTASGVCPSPTKTTLTFILELAGFYVNDINGLGDIVGQDISKGGARPVVWTQGRLVELPSLKGNHGSAQGINNDGSIVGSSLASKGEIPAVLWTKNQ